MLNRERSPWMGAWNGVGGKIEDGESPSECAVREIYEETGVVVGLSDLQYGGIATWYGCDGEFFGGMHIFLVELLQAPDSSTPRQTEEGILDWKALSWLLHPENKGVSSIKYFLNTVIEKREPYEYRFTFDEHDNMVQFERLSLVSTSTTI